MKNIFKLLSVALIGLSLTACVEDIDTPARGPQANPEQVINGVYNGTWTITYTVGTKVTEYSVPGTMTIGNDGKTAYWGSLTSSAVVTENPILNHALTSAVNISPLTSASSYLVYNAVTPNGFDKLIDITKLGSDGQTIVQDQAYYGSSITGQVLPKNGQGVTDAANPESYELSIDFEYNYQCDIKQGRRPAKVDYVQHYHFVGNMSK